MDGQTKEFIQGYGCAVAALIRLRDLPSIAVDLCRCDGLNLEDFENGGVEEYDLKVLRKAFKKQPSPRRRVGKGGVICFTAL